MALVSACCTTRPVQREEQVLTHAEVQAAVAPTDDYEYKMWTATEDDYYVEDVAAPWLAHHTLFRVTPIDTSHPMSFYVTRADGGAVIITSMNAPGLGQVLQGEPELMRAGDLAARVYELLRPQGVDTALVADDATLPAQTIRADDAWRVRFVVLDEGRRKLWTITVPDRGVTRWSTQDAPEAQGGTP